MIEFQVDWQKNLYQKQIAQFKERPAGFGKVIMLGNSITEGGGDWNLRLKVDSLVVNRGIAGDITEGVLARLAEIIHFKPKAVFLLIGINDIFNADHPRRSEITAGYVAGNILKIANTIQQGSPSTSLILQTILPVNREIYLKEKGWFPEHAVPLNYQISEINLLLKSQNKYSVIDLNAAFQDENNELNELYTTDGVHLNEVGYEVWVGILSEQIEKLDLYRYN